MKKIFALIFCSQVLMSISHAESCGVVLEMNDSFTEVMREVLFLTDKNLKENYSDGFQKRVNGSELYKTAERFSKLVETKTTLLDRVDHKTYESVSKKISRAEKNFRKGIYLNGSHASWDFEQKWNSFLKDDKIIAQLNVIYYKYCE